MYKRLLFIGDKRKGENNSIDKSNKNIKAHLLVTKNDVTYCYPLELFIDQKMELVRVLVYLIDWSIHELSFWRTE